MGGAGSWKIVYVSNLVEVGERLEEEEGEEEEAAAEEEEEEARRRRSRSMAAFIDCCIEETVWVLSFGLRVRVSVLCCVVLWTGG